VIDYQRIFHTGVRVPDLDRAMAELGEPAGLRWSAVQEREQGVWTPESGPVTIPLRFTYSTQGPQHVELLQGAPGTIWDGREHPGVHHVGVWADDLAAESAELVAAGWTLVAAQLPPDEGYGGFTYLRPPSGMIVELVTSAIVPMFERWWAGGQLG